MTSIFDVCFPVSIASGSERGPINRMAQEVTLATARGTENFWNRVFLEALKGRVCSLCEVISHAEAGGSPRFFCLRIQRFRQEYGFQPRMNANKHEFAITPILNVILPVYPLVL